VNVALGFLLIVPIGALTKRTREACTEQTANPVAMH
jgi:hypothetical protein